MTVAELGSWIIDLQAGDQADPKMECSPQTCRISDLSEDRFDGSARTFAALVHPEDRTIADRFHEQIKESSAPRHIELRIVRPDGTLRWVRQSAKMERDEAGVPLRLLGVIQDITESRVLGEQLRHAQLTSGSPGTNLHDQQGLRGKGVRLISKPYRKSDLARMLREVIDA